MATGHGTIDFLLDQLDAARGRYTTRRMFGEYCLYRDGRPVALVCDDALFVKDTEDGRRAVASRMEAEYGPPYPGARLHLRLGPERWEDGDWLLEVLERTAAALPPAKSKSRSKSPSKSKTSPGP